MNVLRSFPFQKKELNHNTNSNFVNFSLSLETLLFKQQPNNELVFKWLVTIEYSPTERKLYGRPYKSRLVCKPSYLSNYLSINIYSGTYIGTYLGSNVGSHIVTYIGSYLTAYGNLRHEFLYEI